MQKEEMSTEEYVRMLDTIAEIIRSKGFKSTTMDSVSAAMGISKRTLYEIFDSKDEMIREVLEYFGTKTHEEYTRIFAEAPNVLEGMAKFFETHTRMMEKVSPDFFRDMDCVYKSIRHDYDNIEYRRESEMTEILKKGQREGLIRKDLNLTVVTRLAKVQMESLKRMEENFPPDITLAEAFNYITTGFLRSISTMKGIKLLEQIEKKKKEEN